MELNAYGTAFPHFDPVRPSNSELRVLLLPPRHRTAEGLNGFPQSHRKSRAGIQAWLAQLQDTGSLVPGFCLSQSTFQNISPAYVNVVL